jgi:hypothetical protein
LSDISTLFSSYLSGTLSSIPWSEEPLRPETNSIAASLIRLNDERHWWTVGSQPAVDGAPSSDEVHGFGPKGGYVYQKAFVELFLDADELDVFEERAKEEERARKERGEGDEGAVKWFAGRRESEEIRTNMGKGDVNAVTWGVFGGREIVTTTMIEEMSFKAWKVSLRFLFILEVVLMERWCRRKRSQSGSSGVICTPPTRRAGSSSATSPTHDGSSPSYITITRPRPPSGTGCSLNHYLQQRQQQHDRNPPQQH